MFRYYLLLLVDHKKCLARISFKLLWTTLFRILSLNFLRCSLLFESINVGWSECMICMPMNAIIRKQSIFFLI